MHFLKPSLTQVRRYRRLDAFFARGLTPEILDSMDSFRDGQVLLANSCSASSYELVTS